MLVVLLWIFGVLAGCGEPAFPDRVELDRSWHFKYDSSVVGVQEQWYSPGTKISGWVTVPGGSYWKDSYDGRGWFAQDIWLPQIRSDRSVAFVLTSVSDSAKVWLNGKQLALHRYNTNMQYADIQSVYRPDRKNRFVIMVVDTGGPGGLTGDAYLRKYQSRSELGE